MRPARRAHRSGPAGPAGTGVTPVATIFGIPGNNNGGITSTNGAFTRILQTGVGPGNWLVIATVNNVGAGLLEDTRRSFRMACELREGANGENFIAGNVFTGESYDNRALGDQQTMTFTGGMAVPAGTAQLLSLQCGLYDGSNRTMFWDHEGVRIILLRIDHFFDVSQFPS